MITVTPHWDYPWAIKSDRELSSEEFDEIAEWWRENVESGYLVSRTTRSWFLGYIGDDDEAMALKLRWS